MMATTTDAHNKVRGDQAGSFDVMTSSRQMHTCKFALAHLNHIRTRF